MRYDYDDTTQDEPRRPVLWTVVGIILALVLLGAGWQLGVSGLFSSEGVVAVVPFTSEDNANEPFQAAPVAGLVVLLGTELANASKADTQIQFVPDGGKLTDLRRSLRADGGTRLILEGTARVVGLNVRLRARLLDARSGAEMWTGTIEGQGHDLLPRMTEMAQLITTAMRGTQNLQLGRAPPPPEQAQHQAQSLLATARWLPDEMNAVAWANISRLYELAIQLDARDAGILGHLAWRHAYAHLEYFTTGGAGLESAAELLARAAVLDPTNKELLLARCTMRRAQRLHEEAIAACQAALDRDPKEVRAVIEIGQDMLELSRGPEALRWLQRAEDAVVGVPDIWSGRRAMGAAYYALGNTEAAVHWMRLAVAARPSDPIARAWLAALLGLLGRQEEAQGHLREFLAAPALGARRAGELPRIYLLALEYDGRHGLLVNALTRLRTPAPAPTPVPPR